MRYLMVLFFLVFTINECSGFTSIMEDTIAMIIREPMMKAGATEESVQKAAEGLTATKTVRAKIRNLNKTKRKLENRVYIAFEETTGIAKEHVATVMALSLSLAKGSVDTHAIKYRIKLARDVKIRPDVKYDFNAGDLLSSISLNMEW